MMCVGFTQAISGGEVMCVRVIPRFCTQKSNLANKTPLCSFPRFFLLLPFNVFMPRICF